MVQYKLTYFPFRGRAEAIRMLFALAEVPYENVRITFAQWPQMKKDVLMGALPTLEFDGHCLVQSLSISRYLAKEFGFYGTDSIEQARADAAADQVTDFGNEIKKWYVVTVGYAPGDKEQLYKDIFIPARNKHFAYFQKLLQKSQSGWIAGGEKISYADLVLASWLEVFHSVTPHPDEIFDGFPEVKFHQERVYAIPQIKKHIEERPDEPY